MKIDQGKENQILVTDKRTDNRTDSQVFAF